MKTIKGNILLSMVLTIVVSLSLVGGIACALGDIGNQSTLESTMKKMAVVTGERVSYHLAEYKAIAGESGSVPDLSDPEVSLDDKKELLQQKVDAYGFQRFNLLDTQGISLIDDRTIAAARISKRQYKETPSFLSR